MTEWVELPPGTCGIVEFDFDGDPDQYQLQLFQDDVVTLLSKTSDNSWYKGYTISSKMDKDQKNKGIFPASFIKVQEMKKENMETQDHKLLSEVRSTVRVWEKEMRNTSRTCSNNDTSTYHQLKNRIGTIIHFAGILKETTAPLNERTKHARKRITQLLELNRRSRAGFLVPRRAQGILGKYSKANAVPQNVVCNYR